MFVVEEELVKPGEFSGGTSMNLRALSLRGTRMQR